MKPFEPFLDCSSNKESFERPKTRFHDDFSINNIPFGIARSAGHPELGVVTRYGDRVFFLDTLAERGFFQASEAAVKTFSEKTLNSFAELPKSEHLQVRKLVQDLVRQCPDCPPDACPLRACGNDGSAICHISEVGLHLPFSIGDFTDYSCSEDHVLNAGEVIFKKREAPPGFYQFPVGYTGRTSSIVVSGTPVIRPNGQYVKDGRIFFGPTDKLDYELEIAAFIGKSSERGKPVSLDDAEDHIFGLVVMNDWSARDVQALEMNPLGPLNGKSFCTTISPWVITLEALAPSKTEIPYRNPKNPKYDVNVPDYLRLRQPERMITKTVASVPDPKIPMTYNIELKAEFFRGEASYFTEHNDSSHAKASGSPGPRRSGTTCTDTRFSYLYWTLRDLVAQQTINGCNLNVGDLLATGTISGNLPLSRGCFMERPEGILYDKHPSGRQERVTKLEDGDTLLLTAKAGAGVGFGECVGTIIRSK